MTPKEINEFNFDDPRCLPGTMLRTSYGAQFTIVAIDSEFIMVIIAPIFHHPPRLMRLERSFIGLTSGTRFTNSLTSIVLILVPT